MLGYRLAIPYSIIPPRKTIGLACIGKNDYDLDIDVNNKKVKKIIKKLSPVLEKKVLELETNSNKMKPFQVGIISNQNRFLPSSKKVSERLKKFK